MDYKLTAIEQETVINYNNEEDNAVVYTCSKPLIRKLTKLCAERDDITLEGGDSECSTFMLDKRWIKISPPKQMNLSEEQREARAERMRSLRKK